MIVEGHDWRYGGDQWRWRKAGEPGHTGTWDDLIHTPYTYKHCVICGLTVAPNAPTRPCHEILNERHGADAFVSEAEGNQP